MQTKRFAFLWLLTLYLSVFVFRRHGGIQAAPRTPAAAASSARRGNNSVTKKASRTVAVVANQTEYVTKVQVEDLDEATSPECARLRQLDLCDDGPGGTEWHRNAGGHPSETEGKISLKSIPFLLNDPSCRRSLRPFLCVALTPTCSLTGDEVPAALPPCRTLCSAAAEGCKGVLEVSGVRWPAEWSCGQFPVDGLCLNRPLHHGTGLKNGPNDQGIAPGSKTFAIESRGSLQPPPSSEFDSDPMVLSEDSEGPKQQGPLRLVEDSRYFRGWVDVQGLGRPNDYCRIVGTNARDRILSCAINGTHHHRSYVSKRGFDAGRPRTGFMRDVDGDRRDDYCRCVGSIKRSQLICMKAGEKGFYGGEMQPGSQYTILIRPPSAFADYCRLKFD